MAFFSRKPANWYKGTVLAMVAVTALSAVVYGHHMFMTGVNPLLGQGFMVLTLIISFPAELLFLNWLRTIWKGSIRLTTPMLFALGMVFVFGLGGLTGLYLGAVSPDFYLHDTMFVVGHFHFTMAAASFLASFAALYFWFPKMFGRSMNEPLGKVHFWFTVVGITLVFGGQLLAGYSGQHRRLYDPFQYTYLEQLRGLNRWTSYAAFALFAGQLVFVGNFFRTVFGKKGRRRTRTPGGGTLEWPPAPRRRSTTSTTSPRRCGPHELSSPGVRGSGATGSRPGGGAPGDGSAARRERAEWGPPCAGRSRRHPRRSPN